MTSRKLLTLSERQAEMRERQAPQCPTEPTEDGKVIALEPHFRPKDLASLWGLDESTVRRLFPDQPGVLKIGHSDRRDGKRDYMSIRIPESVALRVHQERSR